jgi:hypothetical protein
MSDQGTDVAWRDAMLARNPPHSLTVADPSRQQLVDAAAHDLGDFWLPVWCYMHEKTSFVLCARPPLGASGGRAR